MRRNKKTADKQEIGLPPRRKDSKRWKRACESFRVFCETYFRDPDDPDSVFALDWSPDHLEVIEWIEKAVRGSLQYLLVMPRGSGKSALLEIGILWAILTGQRRFGVLVAANKPKALEIIQDIKTFLLNNQKLYDDFAPELHGIIKLEGEARKCAGQKCMGKPTGIRWTSSRIVFPTVPGSAASGAVLSVSGMKGAIEGQKHVPIGGTKMIRPDLVLIDDPQTRESASSPVQTAKRIEFINAGIKGLGGPKKGVSVLLAATIMQPGDLTDQLLDRKKHPSWRGKVYQAIKRFPQDLSPWDRYNEIRIEKGTAEAKEFYFKHRSKMDECFEVYWPERFYPEKDEISGIQHFMNLLYDDQKVFWSEYQNEPQSEGAFFFQVPDRKTVESLCLEIPEGTVQDSAYRIMAHADVHKRILYHAIGAVSQDFTFRKIEHGTYPDQRVAFFTQDRCPVPLPNFNSGGLQEAIVTYMLAIREKRWRLPDGSIQGVHLMTIDDRYETAIVRKAVEFVNTQVGARFAMPYKGEARGPSKKPFIEFNPVWNTRNGYTGFIGEFCIEDVRFLDNNLPITLVADVNALKTFLHERMKITAGFPGSVSFCGGPNNRLMSAEYNRYFIDHLYAETPFLKEDVSIGRQKIMWENKGRNQNHWLDCLCALLAASEFLGAKVRFKRADESIAPAGVNIYRGDPHPRGFRVVE